MLRALLLSAVLVCSASAALAGEWVVAKLRGDVLQLVSGEWQPVQRGTRIREDGVVRTLRGRVMLVRGNEVIELQQNTLVRIIDEERRRAFTTVQQHFGEVSVQAEARQVEHFAVQTPYLVAVVKGTRFTVKSGRTASQVSVNHGSVSVTSNTDNSTTSVSSGEVATVSQSGGLETGSSRNTEQTPAPSAHASMTSGNSDGFSSAVSSPGAPIGGGGSNGGGGGSGGGGGGGGSGGGDDDDDDDDD